MSKQSLERKKASTHQRSQNDVPSEQPKDLAVIFLDIDGVLLPFGDESTTSTDTNNDQSQFPDSTMQALSYILYHVPSAKVVLSSTWRVHNSSITLIEQQLQSYAKKKNRQRTKEAAKDGQESGTNRVQQHPLQDFSFFDITNPALHSERQYEIQNWLEHKGRPKISAWVALDDEELLQGKANQRFRAQFVGHVVQTQSNVGLTLTDAQLAVQSLRDQFNP